MTDPTPSLLSLLTSSTSIAGAITAVATLLNRLITSLEQARENHKRRAKLDAYQVRNSWKASDKNKIEQLDPSDAVRRRLERLSGRGRPVIKDYVSLDNGIRNALFAINQFYGPATSPQLRLMILKKTPWLPHFIDAVYSTEHAAIRARTRRHAAEDAKERTREVFRTDRDTVKRAVTAARAERRRHGWDRDKVLEMSAKDFECWLQTGKLPEQANLGVKLR
jgi:hypothetical protein